MCEYSSQDGFANDWHLVHLGCRAQGGAGLVMTEAAAVTPEGRISINDLGIWKDEHIAKLEQIARFIHSQGARAGVQLAHAGRKGSMTAPFGGERLLTPEEGRWDRVRLRFRRAMRCRRLSMKGKSPEWSGHLVMRRGAPIKQGSTL